MTAPLAREESPPSAELASPRGRKVSRYLVLDRIGRGAMGEVFAAYDPALERKVALKLLRPRASGEPSADAKSRLLREAQALAKLDHPNVVSVHDAGLVGDEVFIAMQLVDGLTLAKWLRLTARKWQEVVDVFVQAAKGLAAAHEVGLVHRDFKPANALVDAAGVVHVMDFGLARFSRLEIDENASSGKRLVQTGTLLSTELTVPGSEMGTPAYMAPEQWRGDPVDARADQFAYCVALYDALYGKRPYPGLKPKELRESVCAGEMVRTPTDRTVPPRVRDAVLRGLSTDPQARFPSMHALVSELQAARRSAARRWVLAAGVSAAAAAVGVGFSLGLAQSPDPCATAAQPILEVWNAERRSRIGRGFSQAGPAYATDSWERATLAIERYVADWSQAAVGNCETEHGSTAKRDVVLRAECLDSARGELDALLAAFERAEPSTIENSFAAVEGLMSIESCQDPQTLRNRVPRPTDPAVRAHVDELFARLEGARAAIELGRHADGESVAADVVRAAQELGYEPLQAEAVYTQGVALRALGKYEDARTAFWDATALAKSGGHRTIEARSLLGLVNVHTTDLRQPVEAERLMPLARAAVEQVGPDHDLQVAMAHHEARLLRAQGKDAQAKVIFTQLLARVDGDENARVLRGSLLNQRARASYENGDTAEAKQGFDEGIAVLEDALGPDHPRLIEGLHAQAGVYRDLGERERAIAVLTRAISIAERSLGAEHPRLGKVVDARGVVFAEMDRRTEARRDFERALSISEKALGPTHPSVAFGLLNFGIFLFEEEDYAAVPARLERVIELLEASDYPNPANLAIARRTLAHALAKRGERERAEALARRAIIDVDAITEPHPIVADLEYELAQTLDYLGIEGEASVRLATHAKGLAETHGREDLGAKIGDWLARHQD